MGTPQWLEPGSPSEDQLLSLYLAEALRDKSRVSGGRAYFKVVEELASIRKSIRSLDEDKAAHLSSLLSGLSSCVSLINQNTHHSLLAEILGFPVWGLPQDIRHTLMKLLTHLLINSSSLTHQCLQKLVAALLPPPFVTAGRDADEVEMDSSVAQLQDDVVASIEQILVLVPTAASNLVSVAATCMPHVLRDRATHVLYVRALLRLALGAAGPAVRTGLLTVVMEHLVALDCEIRWQDIAAHAEPEVEVEDDTEDIFQLEVQTEGMHVTQPGVACEAVEQARGEGARGGFEGALPDSQSRDGGRSASASGLTAADHFAEKLDSLMEVVLAHLEAAVDQGQGANLWPAVALVFERTMLRAHRCKFAQYLLWYLCLRVPDTAPANLVVMLLTVAGHDLAMRHQAFYAACQGLFYILCFRLEGMLASSSSSRHRGSTASDAALATTLRELFSGTILQLITHWLSPLAVCAPAVALEFTSLAQRLGLLPAGACAAATAAAATHAQRPLEMFFPFDPYLLRRSADRLQLGSSYLAWDQRHVQGAAKPTAEETMQSEGMALHLRSGSAASNSEDETDSRSSDTSGSESSDTNSEAESELRTGELPSADEDPGPLPDQPVTPSGLGRRSSLPQKVPATPLPHTPGVPAQGSRASTRPRLPEDGSAPAASLGSSPDMGSSGDPMSWTPHIPLRLLQQTKMQPEELDGRSRSRAALDSAE
ncbi:hypothetical protein WJX73_005868 [Symbiochloris irregularis]|uniref:Uncharacterized protein n=1 Tax=Symbiochloris irregularis TaxID=706552 RepID=A0AAW1PEW1_9CHLO